MIPEFHNIACSSGPSWYIDNQDVKLAPNDKIEVKGSRITFEGHSAIVASEVKKGDEVLVLRNQADFRTLSGFLSIKCRNWFYWADRAESKESPVFMRI